MLKKILIIGAIIILLPFQPVTGVDHDITISDEKQANQTNFDLDIITMINSVDEKTLYYYLEKFVSFGYKKTESENASRAAEWIKSEFEEIGLYTYFDEWKFPKYQDKNVIAKHNGTNPSSDAVFLICAHYDTVGNSPGAIDDGTGIAAMLTIANITSHYSFNHTIRFIATGCEEWGTYGSFADAKKAYQENENIIAVLNIDSIGFDNTSEEGNIIQIFSRERSDWILDYTKEVSKKYSDCFNALPQHAGYYPADHESYMDYGYDGIQFVQTKPEECDGTIFHTPNDTIDKVNFSYLENMTKLIIALTCEMAIKPIDVQVRIIKPFEGRIYLRNIPIKLPCFNLWITRIRALTYIIGKTTAEVNITTNEKINSVYFGIDGYIRHICNEPPYEYKIGKGYFATFRLKGHHRLTVCVTTNTGKRAYDEMDIYVVKLL